MTAPAPPQRQLTPEQAAALAGAGVTSAAAMAAQLQLAASFAEAMARLWAGTIGSSRPSRSQIEDFIARVTPLNLGAQRAMAALVAAQLSGQVRPRTAISLAPEGITGTDVLRGQPPSVVYDRPFREIDWKLGQGKTLGEAIDAGRRRFESIVNTDLQLSKTHATREYLGRASENPDNRVVGFRRVPRDGATCALCLIASTQRYHSFALMPIHPNCRCGVEPLIGTEDPGRTLDWDLASQVHERVREQLGEKYYDPGGRLGAANYRDILIVNQHGEIGPVLGVRGQNFAGDYLPHRRVNHPDAEDPVIND